MVKNKKRKIAVVTGTRAEYGLLYWIMREIQADSEFELSVIVTGMHLSPEFGLTYKIIDADGFKIDAKVEMLLSSDTAVGIAKSVGLGIIGFADVFSKLSPDLIIILGDRFEALAAAQSALIHKIPVAHIHGGELSEGAIDDAIRHAITKMSHLHFVAAEQYRKRIIQLGENPKNVFNVGAPGIERIKRMKLLKREELEKKIEIKLGAINFLVTYHPETLNIVENEKSLQGLFEALDYFKEATIIFTKSNADEAGRFINNKIDEYVMHNSHRAAVYTNLGDLNYLSLLQCVDLVIGNSSSGLIEVPYFRKPTINIGDRQKNRLRSSSVIDCLSCVDDLVLAIKKGLSKEFQLDLDSVKSAYTEDDTSKKIVSIIKKIDLPCLLLKKFSDVSFIMD